MKGLHQRAAELAEFLDNRGYSGVGDEVMKMADTINSLAAENAELRADKEKIIKLTLENTALRKRLEAVEEKRDAYKRAKEYWDNLYGQGLEIAKWHMNGNTEPFDNFWESAEDEYRGGQGTEGEQ